MTQIHYSDSLEQLLKATAEECLALRWAHDEGNRWCASWDSRFQIPSIILSFLSGTGAVGGQSLLPFEGGMILVGFVSVFVGILGSVQSYLGYARKAEAHRIAALNYERLHREIAIELTLPRSERKPADKLLEKLRAEIDTLNETAPLLPEVVIAKFKQRFPNLQDYNLPPSLNGLDPVVINTASAPPLTPQAPQAPVRISFASV
jgi:hypothetical protein